MPLAVAILSLIESNTSASKIYIHILHQGLSDKAKEKLQYVDPKYKNFEILFYDISNEYDNLISHLKLSKSNIKVGVIKFLIFDILPEYIQTCLYLDSDILVLEDLTELFNIENPPTISGVLDGFIYKSHIDKIGMKNNEPYINVGIMLINLDKARSLPLKSLHAMLNKQYLRLVLFEQNMINLFFENKGVLPLKYNFFSVYKNMLSSNIRIFTSKKGYGKKKFYSKKEFQYAKKNPAIVHFAGDDSIRPFIQGGKSPYKKTYLSIKNRTAFKDDDFLPNKSSKKEVLMQKLRLFVLNAIPYPLSLLIFSLINKVRKSEQHT
jgi:lipopolysaccharide biosynthesis glycosyltransferase